MTELEFIKIYPELPHHVALFYSDIKKKFNLKHEYAYKETFKYAKFCGCTIGQPGLPAHESKIRLKLRNET